MRDLANVEQDASSKVHRSSGTHSESGGASVANEDETWDGQLMLVSRTLDDAMSARATVDDRPVARSVVVSDAASLFVERNLSHPLGTREVLNY